MKISEMIQELQEILNKEGDLEIYEEFLDEGDFIGMWYPIDPVVRYKKDVKVRSGCNFLPNKFVSLE